MWFQRIQKVLIKHFYGKKFSLFYLKTYLLATLMFKLISFITLMWIMMLMWRLWCHWPRRSWCWCRWPHWCWCRWSRWCWCCWPFWCWCWCWCFFHVIDHVDGVAWTLAPYLRPLSELRPGFLAVLWEICFLSIRIFFFMVTANSVSLVTKPILILYSLLGLRRIIRLECKQSWKGVEINFTE